MLYICTKLCESTSMGFRVTHPNNRVDARVVAISTYGRKDGQKTGSLYRAMPEAGATKMKNAKNKDSIFE